MWRKGLDMCLLSLFPCLITFSEDHKSSPITTKCAPFPRLFVTHTHTHTHTHNGTRAQTHRHTFAPATSSRLQQQQQKKKAAHQRAVPNDPRGKQTITRVLESQKTRADQTTPLWHGWEPKGSLGIVAEIVMPILCPQQWNFLPSFPFKTPPRPRDSGIFTVQFLPPRSRVICRITTYLYGLFYEQSPPVSTRASPVHTSWQQSELFRPSNVVKESTTPRKDISFLYDVY